MIKQQKGLTLIELLIAITIMGLAISLLSSSIHQQTEQSFRLEENMLVHQGMMSATAKIEEGLTNGVLDGNWKYADIDFDWKAELVQQTLTAGTYDPVSLVTEGGDVPISLFSVNITASSRKVYKTYQLQMTILGTSNG